MSHLAVSGAQNTAAVISVCRHPNQVKHSSRLHGRMCRLPSQLSAAPRVYSLALFFFLLPQEREWYLQSVADTFLTISQPDLNSSACSGFQNCFILVGPFHLRYSCFSTLSGQSWSFFCFYLNFNFPKQSLVALIRLIPFFVDYHDTAYPTFMVLSRLVS